MTPPVTRRAFLSSTTAILAAATMPGIGAAPAPTSTSQSARKLNIGVVGVADRGWANIADLLKVPAANIVALCDVDSNHLATAAQKIPNAATYADFREMLKHTDLDAVLVATPDHTHAVSTAAALRAGKHVYCEKPLAHSISEIRTITQLAQETKLVTQMGIQIHALDTYRRVVELIRSGVIGPVKEVHIWHNRVHKHVPGELTAPPANLNYDLWLGPVEARPYHADYHPYNWRRHWAFGTGMLGDIGCHLMDVAFWALDLQHPTRIEAEGDPLDNDFVAEWMIARYDFPARGDKPAVQLTWYDNPKRPPQLADWKLPDKLAKEGVMFVGSEGMVYCNYGEYHLMPEEKFKITNQIVEKIPSSPGHHAEWVAACLANDPAAVGAPFSYGSLLSETALLGTIAFRYGKPLDWDSATGQFPSSPEAEVFLRESTAKIGTCDRPSGSRNYSLE